MVRHGGQVETFTVRLLLSFCITMVFLIMSDGNTAADNSVIGKEKNSSKKLESLSLKAEDIHFMPPAVCLDAKKTTVKINSPVMYTPDIDGDIPTEYNSFENISFDIEGPQRAKLTVYYIEKYKEFFQGVDLEIMNNTSRLLQRLIAENQKYNYKKHKDEYYLTGAIFPYLEPTDAAQLFVSNFKVLHFKNGGKGIRYITAFAQDIVPVCNRSLHYIFQGLTKSKKYYISFDMRLVTKPGKYVYDCVYDSHSQRTWEKIMHNFDEQGFTKSSEDDKDYYSSSGYDLYTDRLIQELNKRASSDFIIALNQLDKFINSLAIDE